MADATYQVSSFLSGEWSKFAQGRTDRPEYKFALNVCLNMLPTEGGGTVRRPGTRFIETTFCGRQARLFRFSFENQLPYTVEISVPAGASPGAVRFVGPTLPGTLPGLGVATNNMAIAVSSISTANPAVVTTATAHGLTTGNTFRFFNLGTSLSLLQNRTFAAVVLTSTTFTMIDPATGFPIDGSTLGSVPAGLEIEAVQAFTSPYGSFGTSTGLDQVRKVQTGLSAVFLHSAVAPQGVTVTTKPSSGVFAQFNLSPAVFQDGPYLDQYIGAMLTPSGTSGSITVQASGSASFPGFQTTDVGRMIRLFSQPAQWNPGTTYHAGDVVSVMIDPVNQPGVATYYAATATTTGNTPPLSPTVWTLAVAGGLAGSTSSAPSALQTIIGRVGDAAGPIAGGVTSSSQSGGSVAAWTWGKITAVNVAGNSATVSIQGPNLLYNNTTIYAWRMGAYGGTNGYPTCGVYTKGRLWLGGAITNRVDACAANGISSSGGVLTVNFSPTNTDGTVGAANAIAAIFNDDEVNQVLWMASHAQGVVFGTQAGEFLAFAPTAGGIAPNNIDINSLTNIGSLNVEACHGEHTLLFVHRYSRKIMEYFADVFSGKFSAPHLTWASKHLTNGGVQEVTYQQELIPTLWARVANALVGWVYKRESLVSANPPTISAGHRHVLGSGRSIESISSGPSVDGSSDTLLAVTNDPLNNIRYIEALTDMPDEGETLLDAQYVDCAVAPTWVYSAPTTNTPYGGMTLSGLWPLNGKKVSVWIGGLDCGDFTVANASINVPFGDGISAGTAKGLLSEGYVASIPGIPIWVGYTYTSQGQLVRPTAPAESGSRNGPAFGKYRRHHYAIAQVEGAVSGSISFGTDFSKLRPLQFKQTNPPTEMPATQQVSGVFRVQPEDGDTFDGQLCWQVTRPYPCNLVSIGGALDTKDI